MPYMPARSMQEFINPSTMDCPGQMQAFMTLYANQSLKLSPPSILFFLQQALQMGYTGHLFTVRYGPRSTTAYRKEMETSSCLILSILAIRYMPDQMAEVCLLQLIPVGIGLYCTT